MDYAELLKYTSHIYVNSIYEPEDNSLIVDIDRCKNNGVSNKADGASLMSYGSIDVDETLPSIRLQFEWYIAYSVRNESFTVQDEYEVFDGMVFSLYSKSRYLDFIGVGTIADDVHPGPFRHYGIHALNHVIDVMSTEPPSVALITKKF